MDKARYPHVTRTWRVERTKVFYRTPQPAKLPSHPFFTPPRRPDRTPDRSTAEPLRKVVLADATAHSLGDSQAVDSEKSLRL
jgi:hypothetical protein